MEPKLFKDLSAEWIEVKRKMVKYSTFCAYNLILHTHLLPLFGDHTVITESEAQEMVLDKLNAGLARKSVRDILATLKAIVKYGFKNCGWSSISWDIVYPTETYIRGLPTLSMASQRKLLGHLNENPTSRNIGILISLCTGMRIGEVCALKWEDVNMQSRVITVRGTVGRVYDYEKKSTERIHTSPKTRSSNREIPISRDLYSSLRTIRKSAHSAIYVVGSGEKATEPRTYRDYFSRLLTRLNIPKIVFHGLRHTFATRCIECQCDYKTVSTILGHSNVSTTLNLYVHPNLDQKKRCIEKFSKYIGEKKI